MTKTDTTVKLGDTLTLDIIDINNLGCGVAKHGGLVVFVKGGVSGDKLSAKVIKVNKSYAVAKLERELEESITTDFNNITVEHGTRE